MVEYIVSQYRERRLGAHRDGCVVWSFFGMGLLVASSCLGVEIRVWPRFLSSVRSANAV